VGQRGFHPRCISTLLFLCPIPPCTCCMRKLSFKGTSPGPHCAGAAGRQECAPPEAVQRQQPLPGASQEVPQHSAHHQHQLRDSGLEHLPVPASVYGRYFDNVVIISEKISRSSGSKVRELWNQRHTARGCAAVSSLLLIDLIFSLLSGLMFLQHCPGHCAQAAWGPLFAPQQLCPCLVCPSAVRNHHKWRGKWYYAFWHLPKVIADFPDADGYLWTNDDVALNYWKLLDANMSKLWLTNDPKHPESRYFPFYLTTTTLLLHSVVALLPKCCLRHMDSGCAEGSALGRTWTQALPRFFPSDLTGSSPLTSPPGPSGPTGRQRRRRGSGRAMRTSTWTRGTGASLTTQ